MTDSLTPTADAATAKEPLPLKEYCFSIREVTERTATVLAGSYQEARQVLEAWGKSTATAALQARIDVDSDYATIEDGLTFRPIREIPYLPSDGAS